MAATDALFWYAESALPEFRPIIAGLYVLDRAPIAEQIEAGVELAIALVPRLRQRVVDAAQLGLPEWVETPLRPLLPPATFRCRAGSERSISISSPRSSRRRSTANVRFEATWIDGLAGGRAVLIKMHHSVVDGVSSPRSSTR
jgi:hypothetical protein